MTDIRLSRRAERPYRFREDLNYGFKTLPEVPGIADEDGALRELCLAGLAERFGSDPPASVYERLERELDAISRRGFTRYHLIFGDIARFAKEEGIKPGRGKGRPAASLVCYCLGITDIDPMEHGLVFELYLNDLRDAPPDIDLEMSADGRERIISYLKEKYGRSRVAFVSEYLPAGGTGKLHRGLSASAVVLTERPSRDHGLEMRDIGGEPAFVYDEYDLERTGIVCLDIFPVPVFGRIEELKRAVRSEGKDPEFPGRYDDPAVYGMINSGDTAGLYILDIREIRGFLMKLGADSLDDIAAGIALYLRRSGEMMPKYIEAKREFSEAPPSLCGPARSTKSTYGQFIYAEQIIDCISAASGCSREYADLVRRLLSRRSSPAAKEEEKRRFVYGSKDEDPLRSFPGCASCGIGVKEAEELFDTMTGACSQWPMAKAHALSFASLAYETAWLKLRFPREFEERFAKRGGLGDPFSY